jgi:3-dehydroquinate synthetase
MLRALQLDKKFRNGKNLLVLPVRPGEWRQMEDVPWSIVHEAIRAALS